MILNELAAEGLRTTISHALKLEERANGNLDRAIRENPGTISVIVHRVLAIGRHIQAQQQAEREMVESEERLEG